MLRILKKILAAPFVMLAAIIVLLEDWLWDDLQRIAAAIGRLIVFRQLEIFIANLPPYAALFFFATPSVLLIPVKLAAVYFLSHGLATLGLLIAIGAKIVGTALVARIFTLTKPKLMQIGWFALLYERFSRFKSYLYERIKATVIYWVLQRWKIRFKNYFKQRRSIWKSRWKAAQRLMKRQKTESE